MRDTAPWMAQHDARDRAANEAACRRWPMPASQSEHHFGHADGRDAGAGRSHLSRLGAGGAGSLHRVEAVGRRRPAGFLPEGSRRSAREGRRWPLDRFRARTEGRRPLSLLCRRDGQRRLQARSLCARARVQRLSRLRLHPARSARLCLARRGIPSAALQRPDRLPIPHRRVLREGRRGKGHPARSRLQVPGCGRPDRVLGRPRRERRACRSPSRSSRARAASATTAPTFSRPRWTTRCRRRSWRRMWRA